MHGERVRDGVHLPRATGAQYTPSRAGSLPVMRWVADEDTERGLSGLTSPPLAKRGSNVLSSLGLTFIAFLCLTALHLRAPGHRVLPSANSRRTFASEPWR